MYEPCGLCIILVFEDRNVFNNCSLVRNVFNPAKRRGVVTHVETQNEFEDCTRVHVNYTCDCWKSFDESRIEAQYVGRRTKSHFAGRRASGQRAPYLCTRSIRGRGKKR